jgi:signal transduction histidine kinase
MWSLYLAPSIFIIASIIALVALWIATKPLRIKFTQWRSWRVTPHEIQIQHELEAERKRIADDLHDDIIQQLLGIGFKVKVLMEDNELPLPIRKKLYPLEDNISHSIDSIRQIVWDLSPPELLDSTFEEAVKAMVNRLDGYNRNILLMVGLESLPSDFAPIELQTQLYRLVHEVVFNAVSNAASDNLFLYFTARSNELEIAIQGGKVRILPPSPIHYKHNFSGRGKHSIRSRANRIGATVVESKNSRGQKTQIFFPIKKYS